MNRPARKINATTQKFIEIEDIVDNIVLLSGGQACMVMEVVATNFALQSIEEQQVKILSYASLLNSLSFSIQIVIPVLWWAIAMWIYCLLVNIHQ